MWLLRIDIMRIETFDFSVNVLRSILWQYNNSENIVTLIQDKQAWMDENQRDFWTNWYTDVFNLQTANDFGLNVWSIILNLPLFFNTDPIPNQPTWGVSNNTAGLNGNQNFDNGNFLPLSGGNIYLTTEEKRILLQLRYFNLTTSAAIPEINDFLAFVFEDLGEIYAMDGLDMTMTYVIKFTMSPSLLYVLQQFDLLPRPSTVGIKFVFTEKPVWGVSNDSAGLNGNQNFNNGNFYG